MEGRISIVEVDGNRASACTNSRPLLPVSFLFPRRLTVSVDELPLLLFLSMRSSAFWHRHLKWWGRRSALWLARAAGRRARVRSAVGRPQHGGLDPEFPTGARSAALRQPFCSAPARLASPIGRRPPHRDPRPPKLLQQLSPRSRPCGRKTLP
jgi:hypothetical protein